jgi:hypothetical protein
VPHKRSVDIFISQLHPESSGSDIQECIADALSSFDDSSISADNITGGKLATKSDFMLHIMSPYLLIRCIFMML